ncbi:LOW QUALITY PROTEIN: 5'-nucleotidase domain-containing protein 2 [Lethenteron reissneri]|uniref:LOW QUALITY PROTEIN: 5'-nucleotidase domain-containing protein 2 n=1 Tax=Lethenteron reissneri TaxID=7753 RepID=UPI002AB70C50|nr:LOW QUALITY PROTEIN: 5'-nucleotidase domain-containing protein 2 [Lethenteron reissneri]
MATRVFSRLLAPLQRQIWPLVRFSSTASGVTEEVSTTTTSSSPEPGTTTTASTASAEPSARPPRPRPVCNVSDISSYLWTRYDETKKLVKDIVPPGQCHLLNHSAVYVNNELCLDDIGTYGFDYDYTLALYSSALHHKIYNAALDILVKQYKYPEELKKYEYRPDFATRGLHYDIHKGLLMKIDAFHHVQLGSVYRGYSPVPDDEVMTLYSGTHVRLHQMTDFYGKGSRMKQYMDVFSIPEMTLLSSVNDHFKGNRIEYDPIHLYKDVSDAVRDVHVKGLMYKIIEENLEEYIQSGEETYAVLQKLVSYGKKLFLITNSPFSFVNKGMLHMVGEDWRDLFDVIIVQAEKPAFFTDSAKPFRRLDDSGCLQWDKIDKLEKGEIYQQGNLYEFLRLTGWVGTSVLYFGDHIYSDLADLTLRHGWRTGAIVPELEAEIHTINGQEYTDALTWLQSLTGLLERMQMYRGQEAQVILTKWMAEREELRSKTKNLFNPYFGSIFRTFHNPTYFSRRLSRLADVYMASVSCLLNYDMGYTFYPRRMPLQHESPLWIDQLCTGCVKTPYLTEMSNIR